MAARDAAALGRRAGGRVKRGGRPDEGRAGRTPGARERRAPSHPDRPPDVAALLGALEAHGVACVLVGSVAAMAYGARVTPGDLDVVPALDTGNLARLAALLREVEASIDGRIGSWTPQADGELKWIEAPETDAVRAARAAAWWPDPSDVASFDHLFRTRHGNLDSPPDVCGTYDRLVRRAAPARVAGHAVRVAHVDDLLATLTVARRAKDRERVLGLRRAQREGRPPGD